MNAQVFGNGGAGMAQPNASARMVGKFGLGAAALGMAAFGAGMLASNGVAPATVIPVANANFASPAVTGYNKLGNGSAVTPGADTFITDWGIAKPNGGYTPVGVQNMGTGQVAYSESVANAIVYQDVGALAPNTTYTLSVLTGAGGYGIDANGVGGTAEIALVNSAGGYTGTTLNSTSYTVPGNTYTTETVTATTGASVSGDLAIELALMGAHPTGGNSNTRVFWTNVSLAAVPEPASLGLLAVGGVALLLIGRRRKLA